ncbi:MAG: 6-phosphofructokinase [Candidatus Omnitrophica bacterium]|nr:6-phosphofructokinase [Candidatus Omnitrophota bacterium]
MKKIGILTGGADCSGLNSVIRAIVRKAIKEGYVITGIKNGWNGLIENDMRILDLRLTSGILALGGTILGTSRHVPPLSEEQMRLAIENFKRSGIDALIVVGGEDTLKIALDLKTQGNLPIVGVPKSIDNALSGTDYAFGFDTAVNIATECIDRLHTTAESHHRIIVIEVMGRYTGWIAVQAGIAGGANIVLIPEYPVDMQKICASIRSRHKRGKTFSIIVVSEGTRILGQRSKIAQMNSKHNIGYVSRVIADIIEAETGYETRVSVLGHIQRGGTPTAFDRILGTRFGIHAVELVKRNKVGQMVSLRCNKICSVDIKEAVKKRKTIKKSLYQITEIFSDF